MFTWQMGATGVALFYAISGFVLYQPFVRARAEGRQLNLGAYAVRRAARIIPAYWAALIIVGLATHSTALFTPRGFLDYFCFFQLFSELDFGPMSADSVSVIVNNPLPVAWTLCVEVSF